MFDNALYNLSKDTIKILNKLYKDKEWKQLTIELKNILLEKETIISKKEDEIISLENELKTYSQSIVYASEIFDLGGESLLGYKPKRFEGTIAQYDLKISNELKNKKIMKWYRKELINNHNRFGTVTTVRYYIPQINI